MRDIVKSIRTQSQMFRQMNNSVQADKLEGWAKYIEELRVELDIANKLAVLLFNSGYAKGHNDTVESCFTDIHASEMEIIHEEIVAEIIEDYKAHKDTK